MANHLADKYADKVNPSYFFKNIELQNLDEQRAKDRLKVYKSIEGSSTFQVIVITPNATSFKAAKSIEVSSTFQVMVITPNATSFKAAPRLCICDLCKISYGSCSLFKEYTPVVENLNKTSLRSQILPAVNSESEETDVLEFAQKDTICAIPASEKSHEAVDFVKILAHQSNDTMDQFLVDDLGQRIGPGQEYLEGRYYLRKHSTAKGTIYQLDQRKVYFFKECIVYPFVQSETIKDGVLISNTKLSDV